MRPRRGGADQPALALPDLGVHPARACTPSERKWSRVFAAVAGPLFLVGVVVGYLTLPKGLEVLIGFTPTDLTNLVEFNDYLTFFTRTLLVFGIAFEIPVFVILLNLAGVVSGKTLGAHRPWIIVGTSSSPPWRRRRPTRSPCSSWPCRWWSCSASPRSSRGSWTAARAERDASTPAVADDEVSPL